MSGRFIDITPENIDSEHLCCIIRTKKPRFAENAKRETIDSKKLTVYYDAQCPFIPGRIESNRKFCEENGIEADFIEVDSLEKAKNLPCVFNNWAVFCGGKFVTVNLLDERALKKLSDGAK